MRLIDADATIEAVEKSMFENPHKNAIHRSMHEHEHRHFLTILMGLPSAQPERKIGHWIPVTNGRGGHQCDRCGCYAPSYQSGAEWLSNFCPECNADMRGDKHETD